MLVLAVLAGMSSAACGGHGAGASPSPSGPKAGPAYAVVVTEQDRTATLSVGQKLLVELHARPGMTDWGEVRSSDTSVLIPLTIDVLVPRGVTVAAFQAVAPGRADVIAIDRLLCSPGQVCHATAVAWTLRVTVSSPTPSS